MPGRVKCGGTDREIVVAHGRLPSPARLWYHTVLRKSCKPYTNEKVVGGGQGFTFWPVDEKTAKQFIQINTGMNFGQQLFNLGCV